jgi:PiT family inorganic phosphate transporter
MEILILALAGLLAFANGANDNAKGVATLVGYGAAGPATALGWAAVSTALGAAIGALAGGGLVTTFRAGFIAGGDALPQAYFAAVLAGACSWVLLATRTGLPVSTTHAILGGLVGAGLVEVGLAQIGWATLVQRFVLPLLTSPLLALALVWLVGRPLAAFVARVEPRCICAIRSPNWITVGDTTAVASPRIALISGETQSCALHSPAASVKARSLTNAAHWGTSGLVGLARGWNDTPKIAALALVALPSAALASAAFALIALAMALGGLLAGRRVLATLAKKITPLPLGESLASSTVSALLVALASWRGLPVSTTHVTTGGIVGAGVARSAAEVRWPVVRRVAASWVVTLPAAALVAAATRILLAGSG